MSDKRFKLDFNNHSQGSIMDRQDKYGQYCRLYDFGEVGRQQIVDLLNELSEENEQLRKELSDCEKFRYSVFKRIEKTIEDTDNCVLNKDAKYPCKAYDECLKRQGTNKPLPCIVNWMMGRPFKNMLKEGDDD